MVGGSGKVGRGEEDGEGAPYLRVDAGGDAVVRRSRGDRGAGDAGHNGDGRDGSGGGVGVRGGLVAGAA